MTCDHCKFQFDTVTLRAKQGTQIQCPSCGAQTTVKYSFQDTLSDIPGVITRDPKYVSRPLTVLFWIVLASVALVFVFEMMQ